MYVCGKWYFYDDCQPAELHPELLTVILKVPFATYIHTYILPPEDGLLMHETCSGVITQ
jgi:hypothetical protein